MDSSVKYIPGLYQKTKKDFILKKKLAPLNSYLIATLKFNINCYIKPIVSNVLLDEALIKSEKKKLKLKLLIG